MAALAIAGAFYRQIPGISFVYVDLNLSGLKGAKTEKLWVCTTNWLADHAPPKGFEFLTGTILLSRWDYSVLWRAIEDLCFRTEGSRDTGSRNSRLIQGMPREIYSTDSLHLSTCGRRPPSSAPSSAPMIPLRSGVKCSNCAPMRFPALHRHSNVRSRLST